MNKKNSPTPFPIFSEPRAITKGPCDHFFASYYGIDSWSPDNRYVTVLETTVNGRLVKADEQAVLGLIDLEDNNRWIPITKTYCWNFQEATMCHWLDNDTILYNDRVDGKFQTVILKWKTGEKRFIPYPTAALAHNHKTIISVNYARISYTRPDYGYAGGGQDPLVDDMWPENDGLWSVDLDTGKATLIVSVASLKEQMHKIINPKGLAYFCHTVYSKDDSKIFFLARTVPDKTVDHPTWETTAFICNADGSDVFRQSEFWASHFNWLDGDTMTVTAAWNAGPMCHAIFKARTPEKDVKIIAPGLLNWDGHTLWMPDGKFISTDGYWDAHGYRTWALCRIEDEACIPVGRFFVPENYRENFSRCDLHPRFRPDGRMVGFNSVHEGSRQVYIRDITPGQ